MSQVLKAIFYSTFAIYLNLLAEYSSVVSSWLGVRCPHYLVVLGKSGVCWSVCWFFSLNLFFCIVIGDRFQTNKQRDHVVYLLIIVTSILIFLALSIIFTVLFAATIPMIGGWYKLWPTKDWEWCAAFLCLVFSIVRVLNMYKPKSKFT